MEPASGALVGSLAAHGQGAAGMAGLYWAAGTGKAGLTVAFNIVIKATVIGGTTEAMTESVKAVACELDEIQQVTPAFLGFTLSSDRAERTVRFSLYVEEDEPADASKAAYAWTQTAITAIGNSTKGWAAFMHPEELERVPA
jgi:hypothetical protein